MNPEPAWLWVIAAILLVAIELATGTYMCLLFAAAAVLAAVLAFAGLGLGAQAAAFLAASLLALALAPKLVRRIERRSPQVRFGVDALIDELAVVTETIDPVHGTGMVKVGGDVWRARSVTPIPAGALVRVAEVSGTKLVVYPDPEASAHMVLEDEAPPVEETRRVDLGPRDT